jgi:hypothetical protein
MEFVFFVFVCKRQEGAYREAGFCLIEVPSDKFLVNMSIGHNLIITALEPMLLSKAHKMRGTKSDRKTTHEMPNSLITVRSPTA